MCDAVIGTRLYSTFDSSATHSKSWAANAHHWHGRHPPGTRSSHLPDILYVMIFCKARENGRWTGISDTKQHSALRRAFQRSRRQAHAASNQGHQWTWWSNRCYPAPKARAEWADWRQSRGLSRPSLAAIVRGDIANVHLRADFLFKQSLFPASSVWRCSGRPRGQGNLSWQVDHCSGHRYPRVRSQTTAPCERLHLRCLRFRNISADIQQNFFSHYGLSERTGVQEKRHTWLPSHADSSMSI